MREIKYRQAMMDFGKFVGWHYWGFLQSSSFVAPCVSTNYGVQAAHKYSQEYTGLHDKNGMEIYEGDILKCTSPFVHLGSGEETGKICTETFEIFYIDYEARFALKAIDAQYHKGHVSSFSISQSQITKYYEVIGNIYENPDLLEVA